MGTFFSVDKSTARVKEELAAKSKALEKAVNDHAETEKRLLSKIEQARSASGRVKERLSREITNLRNKEKALTERTEILSAQVAKLEATTKRLQK